MKNKKRTICLSTILILLWFSSITAFANSSWVWISETRPDDLLPFVIAGTLIIEIIEKDYSRNGDSKPGFIRHALFFSGCYGANG